MAPDFPHMSYRTAFLLGKRFRIKDVSYSFERSKFSDWCYVHLAEFDEGDDEGGQPEHHPARWPLGGQGAALLLLRAAQPHRD